MSPIREQPWEEDDEQILPETVEQWEIEERGDAPLDADAVDEVFADPNFHEQIEETLGGWPLMMYKNGKRKRIMRNGRDKEERGHRKHHSSPAANSSTRRRDRGKEGKNN